MNIGIFSINIVSILTCDMIGSISIIIFPPCDHNREFICSILKCQEREIGSRSCVKRLRQT